MEIHTRTSLFLRTPLYWMRGSPVTLYIFFPFDSSFDTRSSIYIIIKNSKFSGSSFAIFFTSFRCAHNYHIFSVAVCIRSASGNVHVSALHNIYQIPVFHTELHIVCRACVASTQLLSTLPPVPHLGLRRNFS